MKEDLAANEREAHELPAFGRVFDDKAHHRGAEMRRKPKKLPQMNTDQPRWKSKNFICTDQGKSAAHWFYFMFP